MTGLGQLKSDNRPPPIIGDKRSVKNKLIINYKKYMKKIILFLVIVIGFGSALLFRMNNSQAERLILTDGNLYSISNTLGEKNFTTITQNKDIKIIFDQKNGKIIYGKGWEEETIESESTGGTKLYVMNNDGSNEKSVFPELINYALLDGNGQKIYLTTRSYDLYSVNTDGSNPQKIQEKVIHPDLSSDGRYLVYQKLNPDWQIGQYFDNALGITVLDLQNNTERRISQSWEDFNPFWTPDNHKILFFSRSPEGLASHFIMDADGNNRKQLTNIGEMFVSDKTVPIPSERPIWSKDGKYLIYESDRAIWMNKFSDNNDNIVAAKQLSYGRDPRWLVDGKSITVVVNNTNYINQALITVDINDGEIKVQ